MTTPIKAWNGNSALFFSYVKELDAIRVLLDSATYPPGPLGRTYITSNRKNYASGSVTTGAWVELVASLSDSVNEVEIFDSSGSTLELGIGGSGSEARTMLIFPGGNGRVLLHIAAGSRVSIRAVSATASLGENLINFYK